MIVEDLLSELKERDIQLWREGSRLRYSAPAGALTDALRGEITGQRASLLGHLPDMPGRPVILSFAQSRLWFHEQLLPGISAYHIPGAVRIRGDLNVAALQSSLKAVLDRHEVLRTAFLPTAEDAVGVVVALGGLPFAMEDLSQLPPASREAAVEERLAQETGRPFALDSPPLLRSLLLKLADDEHILTFTLHHIAGDGWSIAVLIEEITAYYCAAVRGEALQRAPLPRQYGDFARHQRRHLEGSARDRLTAFWTDYLKEAPPYLELPDDWPRPAVESFEGAEISQPLGAILISRLQRVAVEERTTLFTVFAAAFAVLLRRYTQKDDLVIGTPLSGRETLEDEALIGPFVNTLPIRCRVRDDRTIREFLAHFREQTLSAFQHATLPFEQIVEAVHPPRDLSRAPVYQVMFSFLNQPKRAVEFPGCEVQLVDVPNSTSKLDLTMAVEERDAEFTVAIEFRTGLFAEERIRRMLAHYEAILRTFADDPEKRLGEIDLLSQAEVASLFAGNDTGRELPPGECLHHAFEAQAMRRPEAAAFSHRDRFLTYQDLNSQAARVAAQLQAHGVRGEAIVAVFLPRGLNYPIAVFGILKAGAAFLPLDYDLPAERLTRILKDSGASAVICAGEGRSRLRSINLPFIDLNALDDASGFVPPTALCVRRIAYVIYTSGSTGGPKGVEITHEAAVNLLRSLRVRPGFSKEDVLLAVAPFSFDMSIPDLFLPSSVGGSTVLLDREEALDAANFQALVDRTHATGLQATPSAWRLLLAGGWSPSPGFRIFCGGEAFPSDLAEQLTRTGAEVWNLYGPTETTVWSAAHRILPGEALVSVGNPVDNTQLYVLDEALRPVPAGIRGELYIGGIGLARGYRKRASLTARQFVPNPFASTPGQRLYRTGDLARYHFDGRLEILGRLDTQVKIRGHRIELGEIESLLQAHPLVEHAAVIILDDALGEPQISAFWKCQTEESVDAAQLRTYLAERLPAYMVPAQFSAVETWPQNANGKLDRSALAKLVAKENSSAAHGIPPRNEREAAMTALWRQLLKVPLGVRDNFFAQGGHSLLALHLLACVRRQFGETIALSSFLQEPTVEAVCRKLGRAGQTASRLVQLSTCSDGPPFFFVPGASGNPFSYAALCRSVESVSTFYGFQPPEDACSIEELAEQYVAAVLKIQPAGRIRLGGHSFGAIVAFEMSRQFHAVGRSVALLAVVDMSPPHLLPDLCRLRTESEWLSDIADALARFTGSDSLRRASDLTRLSPAAARETFLRLLIDAAVVPPESDLALVDLLLSRYQLSQRALASYQTSMAACPVTVFRCADSVGNPKLAPYLGWAAYAPLGIREMTIPGDHITLVTEPHVSHFGAILSDLLRASPV
ncbi:MAG TPA: amino acid adenylation domain-containing protein [Chthoniobacter sp.]|jgi:amino acid adenylation domain-containing protein